MDIKNNVLEEMFKSLTPKAKSILKAVIDLINEEKDMTLIKVGDITAKAGVGKGTAYEYFNSKEEIITKAMFYNAYLHLIKIENLIYSDYRFRDLIYKLMDYVWENGQNERSFQSLIRLINGTSDTLNTYRAEFVKLHEEVPVCNYMDQLVDYIMDKGYKEGVIKEDRKLFRKNVFSTQIIQFFLFMQEPGGESKEVLEEFVYEGIIKLLN